MQVYPKRLIEVDLPIQRISAHSRREKSIRQGHISTLHIWWARRPLAACRAIVCATLWPDPADPNCPAAFFGSAKMLMGRWASENLAKSSPESYLRFVAIQKNPNQLDNAETLRDALLDFISDFSNWDNAASEEYLATSRALTQVAHVALGGVQDSRPLIVDPFAGGGSIPLEALRIGADAFASDLNPVPVLLNKVILEYVPKYGRRLAEEMERCAETIRLKAERLLRSYHRLELDKAEPTNYIWLRTILSEAPGAGKLPVEVPLLRSMWLAKSARRNLALRWVRDAKGQVKTREIDKSFANGKTIRIREPILEVFSPKSGHNIDSGTSKGGAATCPITGYTTSVESVRRQLSERRGGTADARLACVISFGTSSGVRQYRLADDDDLTVAQSVSTALDNLENERKRDALPLLPDGELNHLRGFFNVVLYGMTRWRDLFSPRQSLALVTFARLIAEVGAELSHTDEEEFSSAVQTCLAMALGRLTDYGSSLCVWAPAGEFVAHTFGRQALPMVWDFTETNPLAGVGWTGACEWVKRVIESNANAHMRPGTAIQASALHNPLPTDSADATITDPPYYAAIPYADLSDFFYGWLRRALSKVHEDLFLSELAPKEEECVSLSHRAAMYRHKDGAWFEAQMAQACAECRRVTKPGGIGVFVFANKETQGWEAMLGALIGAGWIVTASWPIDTERGGRLRAHNSAALASSVHLVCRPREVSDSARRESIGDWRDILQELPRRIHEWMPRLAKEGVVGADAIFACLGPALEIFSRYSRVEKANGDTVALKEYLEQVWAAVAKEALTMIFTDADTSSFEEDARLTAMWLWTLNSGINEVGPDDIGLNADEGDNESDNGAKKPKVTGFVLEYDAARKIAQGLGAYLEDMRSLVEVKGETARLLPVSERAKALFGKDNLEISPRKKKAPQPDLFKALQQESDSTLLEPMVAHHGATVLDRIHQSMILFAAGRSEAMKRFLVDEGVGRDARFWSLAQALSALYPVSFTEKRWIDGVLARKKGLGF